MPFAPYPPGYVPRLGPASALHEAIRDNVETFLVEARERTVHGFGVPPFVEEELRAFLRCGVLAHGFARVRCGECGHELLLAFSCKRRAVCPSCTGRRAADTAAHLVEEVLPQAPVRQWVLTFPRAVRFALARDSKLLTKVLGVWLRALESFQRRRARRTGHDEVRGGYVSFVQRFGSALNLNVHVHTVTCDGTFAIGDADVPRFVGLPPPAKCEVEALLARIVKRVRRCLERRMAGRDDVPAEALDELTAASVEGRRSSGLRAEGRFEAFLEGYSLHCGVRLHENDRQGIERLCRYGARGPLTLGRLTKEGPDRYRYVMKRTVAGRDELLLSGLELTRKLAVLVPPPRVHQTRFHGVFAPNAKLRSAVVPKKPAPRDDVEVDKPAKAEGPKPDGTYRIDWASLLKRIFKVDILACGRCNGRMRVISVLEEPDVIEKILRHLGLPPVPLPTAPARGQRAFDFEAA